MAEPTTDAGLLPRTYFRAPRVPFDFRAVAIAVLGYLIYWGGSWVLFKAFDPVNPVAAFFGRFLNPVARIPFIGEAAVKFFVDVFLPVKDGGGDPTFWHALVGGIWIFLVWAFFGQAIHRIISLRIARDEGLSVREALAFAAKNFATIALCPLIVAAAIALFYGCNALAGVFIAIPWVGQILALILVPLAIISTLIIILIAIGGVIGMPLVSAAAAWERNGSLDAISRAFSYVFARPLQFLWSYLLIFLFTGVILLVGDYFADVLVNSIDAGVWDKTASGVIHSAWSFDAVKDAPAGNVVTAFVFWLVLKLIWVTVFAYAIYWFLGATTSTYADLRADVDGTEEDEIYLEEEEEDFEALAKPDAPAPPGAPLPPAPPPPPPAPAGAPAPPVV